MKAASSKKTAIATARAEAVRVTASIRERLRDVTGMFWQIGELLRSVQDDKLYATLGYETLRDYIDRELAVAATQAYLMIRVVRSFVRSDAERVGLERAAGLIRYAKVVGDVDPGELVRENKVIGDKPISDASVRDIDRAIALARAERLRRRKKSPREKIDARAAKALTDRVKSVVAPQLGRARKIEVRGDEIIIRLSRQAVSRRLGE